MVFLFYFFMFRVVYRIFNNWLVCFIVCKIRLIKYDIKFWNMLCDYLSIEIVKLGIFSKYLDFVVLFYIIKYFFVFWIN